MVNRARWFNFVKGKVLPLMAMVSMLVQMVFRMVMYMVAYMAVSLVVWGGMGA